jgi:integrase
MAFTRFPVSIRRGSIRVGIYRVKHRTAAAGHVFTVAWNAAGKRLTRQFTDYPEAHAEATLKADQLSAGKIGSAASLNGDDVAALAEARRLCAGTPLVPALREWARARDLTQGNIIGAAEAWKARNVARIARHKVADVVAEFCRSKTAAGFNVADDHFSIFENIKTDLGGEFIDTVSARKLETWLARREHPVSRNTYRKRIVSVWRWAQKRGYLPRDTKTEAEQTERAREDAPVIGIVNVATWQKFIELIRAKDPELISVAAIAGFCGLRRVEIHGQTWEDINLEEKFLRVTKGKRGTPARRLVPLCPAAIEWLMLCPDRTGPICIGMGLDRARKLAREARPAIELPDNCFRHGFISHRVAEIGNIPEVSIEAGNSPQIINRHYRELVTKAEGVAWFAARPGAAGEAFDMAGKAVAS